VFYFSGTDNLIGNPVIWYLGTLSIVDYSALLVFYLIFQAQIHLIGNPVIWYLGTLSIVGYSALLVFYLLRRRRGYFDLTGGITIHVC
jgi:dolichyl-phosphate-mannose--protein O-mannosyl transferase